MPQLLERRRIWVTRPDNQSARLLQLLAEAGAHPVALPLLEIAPPLDPAPMANALGHLHEYDLAIFVSPTALQMCVATLSDAWPDQLPVAVIGPGSRRLAHELGFKSVISPATRFDSEGLLAEPALQRLTGQKIVIFRGDGGRDTLPVELQARGATVELLSAYRRLPPAFDQARLASELEQGCEAIIISSSEAAQHLFRLAGADLSVQLQSRLFFAPHPRIRQTLVELGAECVIETATGDEGILAAIITRFCNN